MWHLSSEGLHEDLHTTPQTQDQVQGGLLLNVVVRQRGNAFLARLTSMVVALTLQSDCLHRGGCNAAQMQTSNGGLGTTHISSEQKVSE